LAPLGRRGGDQVFLAQTVDASGAEYHAVRRIPDSAFEGARRAAWLRHPNLVSIRDLGGDPGQRYVASEYVHGEDLRRVLARVRRTHDQVPIALVTAIGAAAAAGLHHAHTHSGSRRTRHGSVHGGVSPANLLIGYDGTVKVRNLGLAGPIDSSYLAPEQVLGGKLDRRTDVFALGIVLFELATTRRLFKAPTDYLTQATIAEPNIPAPGRFRRGLPRVLEDIILKALAPSPDDRFRSAGELRDALEAYAHGFGMRQTSTGIADYLKTLFGARPFPWLPAAQARSSRGVLEELDLDLDDRDQLGVATLPPAVLAELSIPEARSFEETPGRGTMTPMSWTSQPKQPVGPPVRTRRRLGILAGAAVASGLAGFLVVGTFVRGGGGGGGGNGESEVAPLVAPLPPPPPPPPPPDAGLADGTASAQAEARPTR